MGIFSSIVSGSIGKLIEEGRKLIDQFVTTEAEKSDAKLKFERMVKQFAQDYENELTARHKSDMKSDSWLSKNVRPLMLIFCTFMVTMFALADGSFQGFDVAGGYIDLLGNLLITMVGFYFGSRGVEKWKSFQITKEIEREREKTKRQLQYKKDLPTVSLSGDSD